MIANASVLSGLTLNEFHPFAHNYTPNVWSAEALESIHITWGMRM
jgi:hypothetical protein